MGTHERKEREKEQRREEILQAAQVVFFEKGLQNATMDDIAEKAELSKGTLYLYHRSKEDLYLAVMTKGLELLYSMFTEVISDRSSALEALRRLADVYINFFQEHRNYFRMFHFFQAPQLHKQVSVEMLEACTIQNMKLWNFVIDLIERGVKEGDIRNDLSPAAMAVVLWSSTNAILTRIDFELDYWKKRLNVDLEDVLRKSVDFLLEAVMTEESKKHFKQTHAAT